MQVEKHALKLVVSILLALAVLLVGVIAILAPVIYMLWPAPPVPMHTLPVQPALALPPGENRLLHGESAAWQFDAPADGELQLSIDARIEYERLAGAAPALELLVNGEPIMGSRLANKPGDFLLQNGRGYAYFSPSKQGQPYNLWVLFYSPDFSANTQPGSIYQVMSGEPYRYVFDISRLVQPGRSNHLQITNHSEWASNKLGRALALIWRGPTVNNLKTGAELPLLPVLPVDAP